MGSGVCVLTATDGEMSVIVIVRVGWNTRRFGESVFLGGRGSGNGTTSASDVVLELGGRFEVRFLDGARRSSWSGLVHGERELHALDGAWTTIEIGLARTFFFCSALSDDVSGMVAPETRGFQLLDAPRWTQKKNFPVSAREEGDER